MEKIICSILAFALVCPALPQAYAQSCTTPSFASAVNFSVSSTPLTAVVSDLNLDGKPDLAVLSSGSSSVSVLLGNGGGGFGAATDFSVGTFPFSVAVGDFNLDGKPDLATANRLFNNLSVLLGNGSGGFGPAATYGSSIQATEAVGVGDFNSDGKPDLAAANQAGSAVAVLLGDGLGGFGAVTNFSVGSFPQSMVVEDFNLDGKPDVATANSSGDNVSVLLCNGSGGFSAATHFSVGNFPSSIAAGDLNLDGKPDLVTANRYPHDVSVLLGNGSGDFSLVANFPTGEGPFDIAVGDFNLDGKLDVTTANRFSNSVSVLLGNGNGGLGAPTDFAAGVNANGVAVGDFNLDGKPDLAVMNLSDNNVSVFLNTCGLNTPPTVSAGGPYSVSEGASVLATAYGNDPEGGTLTYEWDLDNDGSFETPGQSVSFSAASFDGPNAYLINTRVTDNGGLVATAQATVNVLNVAPTAAFTATPSIIFVGQSTTLAFSNPVDPSTADMTAGFTYSYDCTNDGAFEESDVISSTHVCAYPVSGVFTAKGRIKDKDGGFTDYNLDVIVQTPQEGVQGIIDQVNALVASGDLAPNQAKPLLDKLEGIITLLDNGNVNTAINQLETFVNMVGADINSGKLTLEDGQPFIDAANAIIAALNAGGALPKLSAFDQTNSAPLSEILLEQNSPNPFNPVTTIQFSVPRASHVRLKVYNSFGAEVATLVDQQIAPGTYSVNWDASRMASGFYLYRLEAEGFAQTRKLLLMK